MDNRKLTISALSKGTGINPRTIGDWRRLGTNPSSDKIACICDFLGISTDYLLTGKENSSPSLRDDERELLKYYNALPELERGKILARLEDKAKEADVLPGRVG